jgi:hypothetical protein
MGSLRSLTSTVSMRESLLARLIEEMLQATFADIWLDVVVTTRPNSYVSIEWDFPITRSHDYQWIEPYIRKFLLELSRHYRETFVCKQISAKKVRLEIQR